MIPSKVIHIREARRRVNRAKRRRMAPQQHPLWQWVGNWLSSRTTRGNVLLAGLVASLVTGMVVAGVLTAPQSALDPETIPIETMRD